ncbi:MAG: hypothetical protein ACRDRR_18745 [Pseudonocardiaceae bacterium]
MTQSWSLGIAAALEFSFKPFDSARADLLEQTATYMEAQGYHVSLTV